MRIKAKKLLICFAAALLILLGGGCATDQGPQASQPDPGQQQAQNHTPDASGGAQEGTPPDATGTLKVHFIDVGQGDSILVHTDQEAVLVDGGTAAAGQTVIDYIKAQGITKLDAVVATHPHEDHIGGLIPVIKAVPVDSFYMPNKAHTTQTFERLIRTVNESGAKRIQARAGGSIPLEGATAEILAPNNTGYEGLNDYSVVLKVTHGKNSFLLTGDAERVSEQEMLAAGHDLKATVLKIGHHGSSTSTSDAFFKAVSPQHAVISCGADNQYGHPHGEITARLHTAGTDTYRTDLNGTIIAVSDGQQLTIGTKASPIKPNAPPTKDTAQPASTNTPETTDGDATVYVTKTGAKYHREGCRSLSKSKKPMSLSEVQGRYGPCKICKPPQ